MQAENFINPLTTGSSNWRLTRVKPTPSVKTSICPSGIFTGCLMASRPLGPWRFTAQLLVAGRESLLPLRERLKRKIKCLMTDHIKVHFDLLMDSHQCERSSRHFTPGFLPAGLHHQRAQSRPNLSISNKQVGGFHSWLLMNVVPELSGLSNAVPPCRRSSAQ